MNNGKFLVTAYENPDLDGIACAIGYAEFLKKKDIEATAAFFGEPHREAQFVFKVFGIPEPKKALKILKSDTDIILVDASDLRGISSKINRLKVVELIDHREINQAEKFTNAKITIQKVGAAATLIAEKFFDSKIPISEKSAVLLFSAIVSNTVNFQANVTTDKDKKMAQWLVTKCTLPPCYIESMFMCKSRIAESLKEAIDHDFAFFKFNELKIGIGQLEILNVDSLLELRLQEMQKVLKTIQIEKKLDRIFLSIIDIKKINNTFVVIDNKTEQLLGKAFNLAFNKGVAKKAGITMRKTIAPILKMLIE